MSKVFFGSSHVRELNWKSTLPGKFDAILEKLDIAPRLSGKRVCIKMHLGGNVGYTTIHPVFVRRLVSFVKNAGGKPFVTDNNNAALSAHERGYAQETIGCPVLPAAGAGDSFYRTFPVSYKNLSELKIAGEILDADYLICFSHAKGHGCTGYGGAIKNIGVGAMIGETRGKMHMVQHAEKYWDAAKCAHFTDGCTACVEACSLGNMRFADDDKLHIGFHECNFCADCNSACPTGALEVGDVIWEDFQKVMVLAAEKVLGKFSGGNAVFINLATNITPFCDCMGITTPNIVPDVGVFASEDMVAVERATLDGISEKNLLPGSLPECVRMRDLDGHLLKKIHGVDPYLQVTECERLGLGSTKYEIEEIG